MKEGHKNQCLDRTPQADSFNTMGEILNQEWHMTDEGDEKEREDLRITCAKVRKRLEFDGIRKTRKHYPKTLEVQKSTEREGEMLQDDRSDSSVTPGSGDPSLKYFVPVNWPNEYTYKQIITANDQPLDLRVRRKIELDTNSDQPINNAKLASTSQPSESLRGTNSPNMCAVSTRKRLKFSP